MCSYRYQAIPAPTTPGRPGTASTGSADGAPEHLHAVEALGNLLVLEGLLAGAIKNP